MALAKEQIRQIISQNDISSVADVYSLMKGKRLIFNCCTNRWVFC